MSKKKRPDAHTSDNANPTSRVVRVYRPLVSPTNLSDLRRWDPTESVAPAASIRRSHARLTLPVRRAKNPNKPATLYSLPAFHVPSKVAICVRRKQRKEVFHAKRLAGRSGFKKPKRNFWSKVTC